MLVQNILHYIYGFTSIEDTITYFEILLKTGYNILCQKIYVSVATMLMHLAIQQFIYYELTLKRLINIMLMITFLLIMRYLSARQYRLMLHQELPSKLPLQARFFVIVTTLDYFLLGEILYTLNFIFSKGGTMSGMLMCSFFILSVFGASAIFKSVVIASFTLVMCLLSLLVLSFYHKHILQIIPVCMVISCFLLFTIKQIDKYSIESYKIHKQLLLEHKKFSLCFENSNNAIAIMTYDVLLKTYNIDYYNSVWSKHPLEASESKDIFKIFNTHQIKDLGTIQEVMQSLIKENYSSRTAIKTTFNTEFAINSGKYCFKLDISIIGQLSNSKLILIQYINNTSSIELAQLKIKETMISSITHELLTPLNLILAITNKASESASMIDSTAMNALYINSNLLHIKIRDFICYSEYYTKKLYINKAANDIRGIISKTINLYTTEALSRKVKLYQVIGKGIPSMVLCDEIRIMQIISNLISNSIKYTPPNGKILVSAVLKDSDTIEISVEDTGQGFDINHLQEGKLHGLGIIIITYICEKMGIVMNAVSKIGQGSKFWFTIKCMDAMTESTVYPMNGIVHLNSNFSIKRMIDDYDILVTDDLFFNRFTLKIMLNKIKPGISITEANNGQEALEFVQKMPTKNRKLLVFMDVDMPIMDGITATKAIMHWISTQQTKVGLMIFGVTAFNTNEDLKQCKDAGMAEAYTKPISIMQLQKCVHNFECKISRQ